VSSTSKTDGAIPTINKIHRMDALEGLSRLPDACVDILVTSPPYWRLRDYGKTTTRVWDGDASCRHRFDQADVAKCSGGRLTAKVGSNQTGASHYRCYSRVCAICGAWEGQLGMEPDCVLYIKHLLDIFDQVRRVLKPHGTCWVNLGDTYGGALTTAPCARRAKGATLILPDDLSHLPPTGHIRGRWDKCLMGVPERFLLGMLNRGWTLRNKVVWHKSHHAPHPVKDRFANAWEYLFLFVQSRRYYFDLDAVREPYKRGTPLAERDCRRMTQDPRRAFGGKHTRAGSSPMTFPGHPKGRNPGDVIPSPGKPPRKPGNTKGSASTSGGNHDDYWKLTLQPFRGAHFAVFPEKLVERPILTSPTRVCGLCGKATASGIAGSPPCKCRKGFKPALVLDPFMGSGTTAVVARRLGRDFMGFEMNPEYVRMARLRLKSSAPTANNSEQTPGDASGRGGAR
jgi:site-specific DNA-methyltransferase (adenine-specific)